MNTMLSPSNQYLRPEYLTPLPTTLDAKKSPLALLAQTCSAIGADTPNPKLISAAEKASQKSHKHTVDNSRDKSSPSSSISNNSSNDSAPKASFKPYESCLTARDKTPEERAPSAQRVRTPVSSKSSAANTPTQPRCSSAHSSSSQRGSPHHLRKSPLEKGIDRSSPSQHSPVNLRQNGDSNSNGSSIHSPTAKIGFTPSVTSASESSLKDLPLGSYKPGQGIPVTSSAFLGGLPAPGFPLPSDLMTSGLLAAQHHAALKAGALNPYLSYARLKAGQTDACRDPYCTGCSLSAHLLAGYKPGACPAGCAQCDHAKTPGFPPGHPAAAYAHAQLAALAAASQLPYVCSWVAGDSAYCGKRFASSEELLQHLRGHAAALGEGNSGLSSLGSLSSLSASGTHPLLPRAYPTPPLSPLAPRFHPYSKPSQLLQHQLPFPLPPHLAAYFQPYPLFGPRGLHP